MSPNPTLRSKSYSLGPGPGYKFFQSQFAKPVPPPPGTSLEGKTVLITGGNVGLGRAACEWLLDLHVSTLIIAVRTPSKGEAVANEFRQKYSAAKIEIWQVDLLSYKSVQSLAAKCQELSRLDIAILNAGAASQHFEPGPEGHEATLQVNYLSTILLATLLLPVLKAKSPVGTPGRLTIVSSATAYTAKLPHRHERPFLPTFSDSSRFDPLEQYAATKAVGHFWLLKIVERVKREDVVINMIDPGFVAGTLLHRGTSGFVKHMFSTVKWLFGRSVRNGSSAIIDGAVVKGSDSHGCYIQDWKIFPYATLVYGDAGLDLANQIWDETTKELQFADVQQTLDRL